MIAYSEVEHIVRNLEAAGLAFQNCQWERCACGAAREDCRQRWKVFELALKSAEEKLQKLRTREDDPG